jgi:hypothetical protein
MVKMEVDSNGADAAEGGAQGKPPAAGSVKGVVRNEARIVARIGASPYEDRYLCPIFGCWRSIQNAEQSGAVRYYGK